MSAPAPAPPASPVWWPAGLDRRVFRRWRLDAGYSPAEACALVPISRPHLDAIERGVKTPSVALLLRLAEVYGKSLGDLGGGR